MLLFVSCQCDEELEIEDDSMLVEEMILKAWTWIHVGAATQGTHQGFRSCHDGCAS